MLQVGERSRDLREFDLQRRRRHGFLARRRRGQTRGLREFVLTFSDIVDRLIDGEASARKRSAQACTIARDARRGFARAFKARFRRLFPFEIGEGVAYAAPYAIVRLARITARKHAVVG